MSLYGTAVRKPVSTALVFVAIVIFGLFSLSRLSVDLLPEIETNTIMVMTAYPGASAELWVMMMTVMPCLRQVSCSSCKICLPVL